MFKNCIITGTSSYIISRANKNYYNYTLTLLSSIYEYTNFVDIILVCDFGLEKDEIEFLNRLDKVKILKIPDKIISHYINLNINYYCFYGFRSYIMANLSDEYENILWVDSGLNFISNPKPIFDIISFENRFFLNHNYCKLRRFISKECCEYMKVEEYELDNVLIWGGMHGYTKGSLYDSLFQEIYKYSLVRECIYSNYNKDHRQQAIISVLVNRLGIKSYSDDIFRYIYNLHRGNEDYVEDISSLRFK